MAEVDLTKAYEAAEKSLNGDLDEADQMYAVPRDQVASAVIAALPYILEAFAAKAAAEACTPHSYNDAVQKVATGIWLCDLAAELPHG